MLDSFHPAVRAWFGRRFPEGPTAPQLGGWRAIAAGEHTLIAAPTGSGKTLAAFLVCIDRLCRAEAAASALAGTAKAKVGDKSARGSSRGRSAAGRAAGAGQLTLDAGGGAGHDGAAGHAEPVPLGAAELDALFEVPEEETPRPPRGPRVVYVSPLKALAVDIQQNLEAPLAQIRETAAGLGLDVPNIQVAVRTGDTPAAQRTGMLRNPPDILVTTPESLYLMVTSERSRDMLRGLETVIVDEIHAIAGNKRGSHLAVTLERLSHLADGPLQRVGLSATQRPIELVARLLVGAGPDRTAPDGSPLCTIVDSGHRRALDLALQLPDDEMGAVTTTDQMSQILDLIAAQVQDRKTTLVFVNTRRMSERVAHMLGERLGEDQVAAHHGSLSAQRRAKVEARLRAGDLRALVATASLELGIDVGPVELVCQLGSPRNFATFLQRVGRSNHTRSGVPTGRLYPTTRDELVECAALLRGVQAGRLDAIIVPRKPLDIVAQQVVAECAAEEWAEGELFELIRRAAPFEDLPREEFDEIIGMLSDGIRTGRGQRAAYLHRDQVNGQIRARRGARLAALTSGGAIPELGDFRVLAEPDETPVGTVQEEWAVESMPGDVFLLGTTSWRIRKIDPGVVRVVDAHGAPPSTPVWQGEAPGRTIELSAEVARLRQDVAGHLDPANGGGRDEASRWLAAESGIGEVAAEMIVRYLATGLAELGTMPTMDTIVLERFFDPSGGMQLVGHVPYGARVNRALGLALRKRFCVTFDFELQAAASNDAILLSLGPQHSFPLERVPKFLASKTVETVVSQAVLNAPMFPVRWRWNLNTSLTVLRMRGGKKNPPAIQRMEADDMMAAVFPTLAACQENVAPGPIDIPDHPLVRQTLSDCLHEAMDIDGLRELVGKIEAGTVQVIVRDTTEPSVLSHEILNGAPFTYLDDIPLEERRSRQVQVRRGLPVEARDLSRLDPGAIERVRDQVRPEVRDADELHDLLRTVLGLRPAAGWQGLFGELVAARRAVTLHAPAGDLWCAVERRPRLEALFPGAAATPDHHFAGAAGEHEPDEVAAEMLRGHLEYRGPSTVADLSHATCLGGSDVLRALVRLETEGFALQGHFTSPGSPDEYCARRVLARIHAYTRERQRREIEPVTPQDYMRFVLRWQHVAPGSRMEGRFGVLPVVEQLQGFELAAGAWETVLGARIDGYRPEWLDETCLSGQVAWGRLSVRATDPDAAPRRGGLTPSRATPITLVVRDDLPWLLTAARGDREPSQPEVGRTREVLDALAARGALFQPDIAALTGRLPSEVEEALWDGVARGLVTADGFRAIRSLLGRRAANAARGRRLRQAGRRLATGSAGRWSLLPGALAADDPDELAEAVAEQLIARWGVVFRDLTARENLAVSWRDLLWAMRRMEARGTIRGGRFVNGFRGEQFALPEAVDALRSLRKIKPSGERVTVSAADPLNLAGIILPGPRVPALPANSVTYVDGMIPPPDEQTPPSLSA